MSTLRLGVVKPGQRLGKRPIKVRFTGGKLEGVEVDKEPLIRRLTSEFKMNEAFADKLIDMYAEFVAEEASRGRAVILMLNWGAIKALFEETEFVAR